MNKYSDIIYLPHHISETHTRMSRQNRAAQFSSFDALTGYDDILQETARITSERRELSEDKQNEINRILNIILEKIHERPEVRVTYFTADKLKNGGKYETVCGAIRTIDELNMTLIFTDRKIVPIRDIYNISI